MKTIPFSLAWRAVNGPPYVSEHAGIPGRKYRFDFAWPEKKVALEIDGGLFLRKGGHTTGVGKKRDMEKDWIASQLGWRVIRWSPDMVGVDNCERLAKLIVNN